MASARKRIRKHFQLDAAKLKRAQKALGAKTETETIELALDLAIIECRRNQIVLEATDRFIRSGIEIKDACGKLSDRSR